MGAAGRLCLARSRCAPIVPLWHSCVGRLWPPRDTGGGRRRPPGASEPSHVANGGEKLLLASHRHSHAPPDSAAAFAVERTPPRAMVVASEPFGS